MTLYTEHTTCRACSGSTLLPVLDFGQMAISDFPKPGGKLDYAPLTLVQCPTCELVQLKHSVNRDRLYCHYYYKSGLNESMVAALRDVAEDAMRQVDLQPGDRVLDIGANDGTLLKQYPKWLQRHGFEPSDIGYTVEDVGIWHDYFPPYQNFPSPPKVGYKIITALAMFYDLDDPTAFLEEVKRWLHPDGVFILQMPDLFTMLHQNAFDNVCAEHLCYWPTRTLYRLARKVGLRLSTMSTNAVNGGSVRYSFKHSEPFEKDEWPTGFYNADLAAFAERVARLRDDTRALLTGLKAEGKSVWAYGASTKGNTLLQYYGIGPDLIAAVADRNPDKVGRTMVTGIPIVSEDCFRRHHPDYTLILPWGFLDAFRAREADYLQSGGHFIVPLPELRIIGDEHAFVHSANPPAKARAGVPEGHFSVYHDGELGSNSFPNRLG